MRVCPFAMPRTHHIATSLLLACSLAACAPPQATQDDGTEVDSALESTHTGERYAWARYIKNEIAPSLVAVGVAPNLIRRVAWFALQQGVFTIASNPEYGQPDGAQSPLGMSNCGDDPSINVRTAFPDCFGAEGYAYRSGNWQVGIGGVQVTDYLDILPRIYKVHHGDTSPSEVGQDVLASLGETRTFPDLTIEEIATPENARWASVILRDPIINVHVQTYDTWIRDGRNLGYGASIIRNVWSE